MTPTRELEGKQALAILKGSQVEDTHRWKKLLHRLHSQTVVKE
jgi:hypothetical protein